MSTYHLHARLFEGTLAEPTRDELQTGESNDLDHMLALAEALAARGFAVWVYEHGPTLMGNGEGAFRAIAEWGPDGRRRR